MYLAKYCAKFLTLWFHNYATDTINYADSKDQAIVLCVREMNLSVKVGSIFQLSRHPDCQNKTKHKNKFKMCRRI